MKRVYVAVFLLASLAGLSACTESTRTAKAVDTELMQISSIHWDEVTAADRAARVNNNNLIMMR